MTERQTGSEDAWDRITDYYESLTHRGQCREATHTGELQNPVCGDWVRWEIRVSPRRHVDQVRFEARGCMISQASAAILAEFIERMQISEIAQLTPDAILRLFGAPLSPRRVPCCLLAWMALEKLLPNEH